VQRLSRIGVGLDRIREHARPANTSTHTGLPVEIEMKAEAGLPCIRFQAAGCRRSRHRAMSSIRRTRGQAYPAAILVTGKPFAKNRPSGSSSAATVFSDLLSPPFAKIGSLVVYE
jgi:hypothetical protein